LGFILLGLISCLTSCQISPGPLCVKDGIKYGVTQSHFRGRWFNYYERGLSYMEGGCFQAALADFQTTLGVRDFDSRRINTYGGMHFIRYFPHRESGISYYQLSFQVNDPLSLLEKARNEIHQSLSQDATFKAGVWKARIEQRMLQIQKSAISRPSVTIKTVNNQSWVSGKTILSKHCKVTISGEVDDSGFISEILLNNKPLFIQAAQKTITFNQQLSLKEGFQTVKIHAKNLLHGETDIQIPVIVDTLGPQIKIMSFDRHGKIRGSVRDQGTQVSSVYIQLQSDRRAIHIDKTGCFQVTIHPDQITDKMFIVASDQAGNTSRILINQRTLNKQSASSHFWASAENIIASDLFSYGQNSKISKPEILFFGWPDKEHVYIDCVLVEGQVTALSAIKMLTIQVNNQKTVCKKNHTEAFIMNFGLNVHLRPGNNSVRVSVTDRSSKSQTQKLTIERSIPDIEQLYNRYTIQPLDFDLLVHVNYDEILKNCSIKQYSKYLPSTKRKTFQHLLHDNIKKQGRFNIHPKENQTMDAVILGDTTQTNEGIEVNMRLVEYKNREILKEFDSYTTSCSDEALRFVAKHLCKQLHDSFQRYQGTIKKIIGDQFVIYKDSADPVISGWPMIIYQSDQERFNPVTHISLGTGTRIKGFGNVLGKADNSFKFLGASRYQPQIGYKVTNK